MNTRIRAATLGPAIALALLCASNVSAAEPRVARRAPAETPPISQNTHGSPDRVVLLAIDDVSLPLRKNVCLYLSKPTVRAEPVLVPSPVESTAPDNLAAHFYGTVLARRGQVPHVVLRLSSGPESRLAAAQEAAGGEETGLADGREGRL